MKKKVFYVMASIVLVLICMGALPDAMTGASVTIAYEHHELHQGDAFVTHIENTCTNTGEMTVLAFNTPDTAKWIHMAASAHATSGASFTIVEAPSIDPDESTSEATPYNRNRNHANTAVTSSIETAPVANEISFFNETAAAAANITTTVTLWDETIGETGNLVSKSAGVSRGQVEFILKQNTQYAFIVASDDDNDNVHSIALSFYQHTNR